MNKHIHYLKSYQLIKQLYIYVYLYEIYKSYQKHLENKAHQSLAAKEEKNSTEKIESKPKTASGANFSNPFFSLGTSHLNSKTASRFKPLLYYNLHQTDAFNYVDPMGLMSVEKRMGIQSNVQDLEVYIGNVLVKLLDGANEQKMVHLANSLDKYYALQDKHTKNGIVFSLAKLETELSRFRRNNLFIPTKEETIAFFNHIFTTLAEMYISGIAGEVGPVAAAGLSRAFRPVIKRAIQLISNKYLSSNVKVVLKMETLGEKIAGSRYYRWIKKNAPSKVKDFIFPDDGNAFNAKVAKTLTGTIRENMTPMPSLRHINPQEFYEHLGELFDMLNKLITRIF